jgi:hypothetical protein
MPIRMFVEPDAAFLPTSYSAPLDLRSGLEIVETREQLLLNIDREIEYERLQLLRYSRNCDAR